MDGRLVAREIKSRSRTTCIHLPNMRIRHWLEPQGMCTGCYFLAPKIDKASSSPYYIHLEEEGILGDSTGLKAHGST